MVHNYPENKILESLSADPFRIMLLDIYREVAENEGVWDRIEAFAKELEISPLLICEWLHRRTPGAWEIQMAQIWDVPDAETMRTLLILEELQK